MLGQFQTSARELTCSQPEHPNPADGQGGAGGGQGSFVPGQGTVPWLIVQQILNSPPKGGVSPADGKFHCTGTQKSWVWLFQQPDTRGKTRQLGKEQFREVRGFIKVQVQNKKRFPSFPWTGIQLWQHCIPVTI